MERRTACSQALAPGENNSDVVPVPLSKSIFKVDLLVYLRLSKITASIAASTFTTSSFSSFLDPRHEMVGVEFDTKGPYAISVNDEIAIVTAATKLNRGTDGKVKGSPFQKLTIGEFGLG